MRVASCLSTGLPRINGPSETTVSAARMVPSSFLASTARAFSVAMRPAKAPGASPGYGSSRISAGWTTKSMPAFRSSSWRRGDAEASTMEDREDKRLRFQEDIVDEARVPDKRSHRGQSLFSNRRLRFERIGIDDFPIVEPDGGLAGQFRFRRGHQLGRLALPLLEDLAGPQ